jgi:hypothetical protein
MKKMMLTVAGLLMISLAPTVLQAQTYVLEKTVDLPGDGDYDYLAIDKVNDLLYVSYGTTVNVVNLKTEKAAHVITGLRSRSTAV